MRKKGHRQTPKDGKDAEYYVHIPGEGRTKRVRFKVKKWDKTKVTAYKI